MEKENGIIEPLFEKVEQYSKTSIEIWKLKAIDKVSDFSSIMLAKLIWFMAFVFFILFLSLAMSFYFGYILNNLFFGFMIVALFYAVLGAILVFSQNLLGKRIKNQVVKQLIDRTI